MHCPSCEKLLHDEFSHVPGVESVEIDRKTNSAKLFYGKIEPDFQAVQKTAQKFGYQAFKKEILSAGKSSASAAWLVWLKALAVVLIIVIFYRAFQNSGFVKNIALGGSQITFGISFLIGLAASVSSCLAVVGAVVIAFSEKYRSSGKNFYQNTVKPNLLFHIGRLAVFFILGGILGIVGGGISISGNFVSIFMLLLAIVMAWLGLNILGIMPAPSLFGMRMPAGLSRRWDKLKKSEHKLAPFALGGLTFFLPCGFTQSMQIFALASGSFLVGGLSLFLFALGTAPALFMVGLATSWSKSRRIFFFQKAAGILIIIFAIYTFNSGFALRGVRTNVISSGNTSSQAAMENQPAPQEKRIAGQSEQVVRMNVTSNGFEPSVFTVQQGIPVTWVINGVDVTGCTSTIIVPSLNISKILKAGENIIRFTPQKNGAIPFSCGMGMVRGKFIVQ
jgi:sulfite exporter TauE/SafE/copper chaperone CopZ